jgi:hypothetical protein
MAEVEIVQPRPSHEVVSKAEGPWILPQAWKTPARVEMDQRRGAGVSHTCLDGLRPPTGFMQSWA